MLKVPSTTLSLMLLYHFERMRIFTQGCGKLGEPLSGVLHCLADHVAC